MFRPRNLLVFLTLLLFVGAADAQRGGRSDGSKRRPNERSSQGGGKVSSTKSNNDYAGLKWDQRLWYGVGGTLNFVAYNGQSFAQIGLTPMVGYKFNNFLSAGPRVGATTSFIKGPTDQGANQRFNLTNFTAGAFARAKIYMFYAQAEFNALSSQYVGTNNFGEFVTEPNSLDVLKFRESDSQFLLGIGYNPGGGGGSTDIGLFYNIFDDVNSTTNPFVFRVMLTLKY